MRGSVWGALALGAALLGLSAAQAEESVGEERVELVVSEGVAPGTQIAQLPLRPLYSYRLNEQSPHLAFDSATGALRTTGQLDREALPSDTIRLLILGSQPAGPTYLLTVSVKVEDLNDNAPQWPLSVQNISIPESARVGTRLALATATDPDAGENGRVADVRLQTSHPNFRLLQSPLSQDEAGLWELEITAPLDRETAALHRLNVTATDAGRPPLSSQMELLVTVLDANDHAPVFAQSHYWAEVRESLPLGSPIASVSATDADEGLNGEVRYELSNDPLGQLSVDSKTGLVRSAVERLRCPLSPPTAERPNATRLCVVAVEAVDGGRPSQRGRAFLNVALEDENLSAPSLLFRTYPKDSLVASVEEDAAVGQIVAVLTTSDPDAGPNGLVSLAIPRGDPLGHFSLQSNSLFSLVRLAKPLVPGQSPERFNLTVVATDAGLPPKSTTEYLPIFVRGKDQAPPRFNQTLYAVNISEDAPPGSFVASLSATSREVDGKSRGLLEPNVRYTLESGNELGWFALDPHSGLLTTATALDLDAAPAVNLSVSARDLNSELGPARTLVAVSLVDANTHTPAFRLGRYEEEIELPAPSATRVLRVDADDKDSGVFGQTSFRWAASSRAQADFAVDASSGVVSTARAMGGSAEAREWRLAMEACDGGRPPRCSAVPLLITAPPTPLLTTHFYPDHHFVQASTHTRFIAKCHVRNPKRGLRYALLDPSQEHNFALDPATGILARNPSRNLKEGLYEVLVTGEDEKGVSSENNCSVKVFVWDSAVFQPIFTKEAYSFSVAEDAAGSGSLGRAVGSVSAADPDASAQVHFLISDGDPDGVFSIGQYSGEIRSRGALDREAQEEYRLRVTAVGRKAFAHAPVALRLSDLNDNAPRFLEPRVREGVAEVTVPRDAPTGAPVFFATATDPDVGDAARLRYVMEPPSEELGLDPASGLLSLLRPAALLSARAYALTVTVSDAGQPPQTSQLRLTLSVQGPHATDRKPAEFLRSLQVAENTPLNSRLEKLEFPGPFAEAVEFRAVEEGGAFSVFPDGWLYVRSEVDFEAGSRAELTVQAFLPLRRHLQASFSVVFHILDVNDNRPVCPSARDFRLRENAEPWTSLGSLMASDPDTGLGGRIVFELLSQKELLHLEPSTGELRSLKSLDRETILRASSEAVFEFTVRLTDQGTEAHSTTCQCRLLIEDEEDSAPVFTLDLYSGSVEEGQLPEEAVLSVTATDEDEEPHLRYAVRSGDESSAFRLDPTTGQLFLLRALDREAANLHKLIITASDGVHSTSATAVVRVRDVNDQSPVFISPPKTSINISEATPLGSLVTQLQASDGDSGLAGELRYYIRSGNAGDAFQLDPISGRLWVVGELDFERQSGYSLVVAAEDLGEPALSSQLPLTIQVTDANDLPPELSEDSRRFSVSEDAEPGSFVGELRARDADSGLNALVRYQLLEQSPRDAFHLNAESGVLTVAEPLDREREELFRLRVRLTDSAEDEDSRLSSEAVLEVAVGDVNDSPPRFLGPHAAAVEASAPSGYKITSLRAVDPDAGLNGSVGFRLHSEGPFGLSPDGALYLKDSLPAHGQGLYQLQVEAVDRADGTSDGRGRLSTRQQFSVVVVRRSAEVAFEESAYAVSVSEDAVVGAEVGRVAARGEADLLYFVVRADGADGAPAEDCPLDVEPKSGRLRVTRPVDRESVGPSLTLHLVALGSAGTANSKVLVSIEDANGSPPVVEEARWAVSESAAVGTAVGTLNVSDPDTRGTLAFRLLDSSAPFALEPRTGRLSVARALDRETRASYALPVEVRDGPNSVAATIWVMVEDENDSPPTFAEASLRGAVSEAAGPGALVAVLQALDPDHGRNAQLRYAAAQGPDPLFDVDELTGIVRLRGELDFEQQPLHSLRVTASDGGQPPLLAEAELLIFVDDANDNPPTVEVTEIRSSVSEAAEVGQAVAVVRASDADVSSELSFRASEGDPLDQWAVDGDGTLRLAKALDRETMRSYQLTVVVSDGRSSASALVRVAVEDVNDQAPRLVSPARLFASATGPEGQVLATVTARDPDRGPNSTVEYRLGPRFAHLFSLDPVFGILRRKDRPLVQPLYNISLTLLDHGTPRLSSHNYILVKTSSEGQPREPVKFLQETVRLSLAEDTGVGKSLLQLGVSGGGAEDVAFWLEGDEGQHFAVSSPSGVLSLRRPLDFEERRSLNFSVCAGRARAEEDDSILISVEVEDTNDNAPFWGVFSPHEVTVVESAVGSPTRPLLVAQTSALDPDSGLNGKLSYSLVQGNTSVFALNAVSGELSLISGLDREAVASYELRLQATDSGSPRRSAELAVLVTVEDWNDNAPRFQQPYYETSVVEGPRAQALVATLRAEDADARDFGLLAYSIASADGAGEIPFAIDRRSGEVSSLAELDREERREWRLRVTARDSAPYLPLSASVLLTVRVEGLNDNPPRITAPTRQIYVPDDLGAGDAVFAVAAEDPDEDALSFSLGPESASEFRIGEEDGVVYAKASLLLRERLSVLVLVTDGENTVSAAFTFFVAPAAQFPRAEGDLSPVRVTEGSTGLEVARISASSPKPAPFNRLRYQLIAGDPEGAFTLEAGTGRLVATERLDRERRASYSLWFHVSDADSPPLSALLSLDVTVSDRNDQRPQFQSPVYFGSVEENAGPGAVVLGLTATDGDAGDNARLTYELVGGNEEGRFAVDALSGVVSAAKGLDREERLAYELLVRASDGGAPPLASTALLRVAVADQNDNGPRFTRLFRASVPEDLAVGSVVTQITSVDPDSSRFANNTYQFSENPGQKFAIHPFSGNVTLAKGLDRESEAEVKLKVVAVDAAWRVETTLTVAVEDVNDSPPVFSQDIFYFSLTGHLEPLRVLGRVTAKDADEAGSPNSRVSYRLAASSDLFALDSGTGELTALRSLRSSQPQTQELRVVAEDAGRPRLRSEATVVVRLNLPSNHPPVFPRQSYEAAVSEGAEVGTKLLLLSALDPDEGRAGQVSYSLQGPPDTLRLFGIDAQGWLHTTGSLSGLAQRWEMKAVATDNGEPVERGSALVEVRVEVENEHAPLFASEAWEASVSELAPLGKAVLQLSGKDPDEGLAGKLSYRLLPSDQPLPFSVDPHSGTLSTNASLLDQRLFTFQVLLSDQGFPRRNATATVAVKVEDENNHRPVFLTSSLSASVAENSEVGALVGTLSARDEDWAPAHSTVLYRLVGGVGWDALAVDERSGQVRLTAPLDFEDRQDLDVQVEAGNPGWLVSQRATLHVRVLSRDEFPPVFDMDTYSFTLPSKAPKGFSLGSVNATDQDDGPDGQVFYSLDLKAAELGLAINPTSGEITTTGPVAASPMSLAVFARNGGLDSRVATATVEVVVEDSGAFPSFSQAVYRVQVAESAAVGSAVAEVEATAGTEGVLYRIVHSDGPFAIDGISGRLTLSGELSFRRRPDHRVTVEARAGERTAQAVVLVDVERSNSHVPVLSDGDRRGWVREGSPSGTAVLVLRPSDADEPERSSFLFRLLPSEGSQHFSLDEDSGVLTTKSVLDREERSEYRLKVGIADGAGPDALSSEHEVLVRVGDVNDQPSLPSQLTFHVLHDASGVLGTAGSVHPVDPDLVGSFQCQPKTQAFLSVDSRCTLSAKSGATEQKLALNASDGVHAWVAYHVQVLLRPIQPAQLSESVLLQIDEEERLPDFVGRLRSHLGPDHKVAILSVNDSAAVVGLESSSGSQVGGSEALRLLRDAAERLGEELVSAEWSHCAEAEPCANGGSCEWSVGADWAERRSVRLGGEAWSVPAVGRSWHCRCPRGFAGRRCETEERGCEPSPCANGGQCRLGDGGPECVCAEGWEGPLCEEDRDECLQSPCANGGFCQNSPGSFHCLCLLGYAGATCADVADSCSPNPCLHGATCVPQPQGFRCLCPPGHRGQTCQLAPYALDEQTSYKLPPLSSAHTQLSFEFATTIPGQVLLQSRGLDHDQLKLSITESGHLLFNFTAGSKEESLQLRLPVDTGDWRSLVLTHQLGALSVAVGTCAPEAPLCEVCSAGDESCSGSMEVGVLPAGLWDVWLGRSPDAKAAEGGGAFVGCVRALAYAGRTLEELVGPERLRPCQRKAGGPCGSPVATCGVTSLGCRDHWYEGECECRGGFRSRGSCDAHIQPTALDGGFLRLVPRPSWPYPPSPHGHTLRLHFRTQQPTGLLFFSATGKDFSLVDLWEGQLRYLSQVDGEQPVRILLQPRTNVSDGEWHSLYFALGDGGRQAELRLDGEGRIARALDLPLHDFLGPRLSLLTVGGLRRANQPSLGQDLVKVYGVGIPEFRGCLQFLRLNGEAQPLEGGRSGRLLVEPVGSVSRGCAGPPSCLQPPCVPGGGASALSAVQAALVVAGFFVFLSVLLLCVCCVWRNRRRKAPRSSASSTRLADIAVLTNKDLMPAYHQTPTLKSSDIQHHHNLLGARRLPQRASPSPNGSSSPPPFYHAATPTSSYHNRATSAADESGDPDPDRYDLENASSIGHSDLDGPPLPRRQRPSPSSLTALKASLRPSPASASSTGNRSHSRRRRADKGSLTKYHTNPSFQGDDSSSSEGESHGESLSSRRRCSIPVSARSPHAPPRRDSSSESASSPAQDLSRALAQDLDLSHHRRPRHSLPPPYAPPLLPTHVPVLDTASETESENCPVPSSLDPFRPPRLTPNHTLTHSPSFFPSLNGSPASSPPDQDLEAYV